MKFPNLAAALDAAAVQQPAAELVFVADDGMQERRWSYPRARQRALEVASALTTEHGLCPGERVALILPQPESFVLAFFGVQYAGGVPVTLYPPGVGQLAGYLDHCRHILGAAGVSLVLTTRRIADELEAVLPGVVPGLRRVAAWDALAGDATTFHPACSARDDLALIQFTSGSTARPKGVALTHRNLITNSVAIMGEGLHADGSHDRGVSWLPLYHDMGLIGFVIAALVGTVPVTFIPTTLFLRRPAIWLRVLSKHRGSITYAPNFAYALAAEQVRDSDIAGVDLSALRVAGCGAEPIQAETLRAFARRFEPFGFKPEAFVPSYGMAESSLAISFGHGLHSERVRLESLVSHGRADLASDAGDANIELVACGRPFRGHALQIVDAASGQPRPARHIGEILVKGPSVAHGYVREAVVARDLVDDAGWLHTGDLGYLDASGQVFVCGRSKDLIIVNGRNLYPQDLEWAAAGIDQVRPGGVVAFGVPTLNGASEAVVLIAESKLAHWPVEQLRLAGEIRAAIQHTLGVTVEVHIVPPHSLPKTSSGKVQRGQTRERYEAGTLRAAALAESTRPPHATTASTRASNSG